MRVSLSKKGKEGKKGFSLFAILLGIFAFTVFFANLFRAIMKIVDNKQGFSNSAKRRVFVSNNKTPRKKKRLEIVRNKISSLKKEDIVDIDEIYKGFGGVSRRTMRRDMDKLEKEGLIKQRGMTRDAVYLKI